ncbi:MAG: DUF5716 family protein [Coprococcus sp.]
MNKQKLIVGYDLCSDYSQISYYNREKMEPDSVSLDGQMQIPTVLCRVFADSQWLVGDEALTAAKEGKGALVRGFTDNIADDPLIDVAGERMEKADLIYLYISATLKALDELDPDLEIGYLTLTTEKIDLAMADAIKNVGRKLGLPPECLAMQSHRLSYEYYALSQKRELWTHDVGLFEYDRHGLRYHHLSISWKHHPAAVTAETVDLKDYLDGSELENPVGPELDRKFLAAVKEVSARKTISTYYLVGEGFEDAGEGGSWMNVSLQQLCAMKRHVFVGQNLYARGACYNSYYHEIVGRKPGFLAVNADMLMKDIYVRSIHRNTPQKMILAEAGTPWYSAVGEKNVILDGSTQLVFHIRDTLSNFEQTAVMQLDDLPERPDKTTMLRIQISFRTDTCCHVRVTDMGFGEIFAATGSTWEKDFDINDSAETAEIAGREAVIEIASPKEVLPLDMKMSGIRIFSLEELCWYLAQNVYAITLDLFDEKMFFWMDRITGDHSLALALANYKAAGKPLKEIVRLMLTSVDYLSNSEIAFVYNKLTEMEHQNPVEQARQAADNYNRYGYYMAALKSYHHVIYQMTHEYGNELTRQFKAETWHNMGIAFLKLHHPGRAAECMEKAFGLVKDQGYLEAYIYTLELMGAHDKILEVTQQESIPSEMTDEILLRYRKSEASYAISERGVKLQQGMELKKQQRFEEYSCFVKAYLEDQKKKYDLP